MKLTFFHFEELFEVNNCLLCCVTTLRNTYSYIILMNLLIITLRLGVGYSTEEHPLDSVL